MPSFVFLFSAWLIFVSLFFLLSILVIPFHFWIVSANSAIVFTESGKCAKISPDEPGFTLGRDSTDGGGRIYEKI